MPTWAAAGDVNGDGFGDVVAMTSSTGGSYHLVTYLGSSSGPQPASNDFEMPDLTLPAGQAQGGFIADVNADGYGDWISVDDVKSIPSISVFFGSSTGLSSKAVQTVTLASVTSSAFAYYVGDVNGDGYPDMLVVDKDCPATTVRTPDFTGIVYLYQGNAGGLSSSPTWTTTPNDDEGMTCGGSESASAFPLSVTFGDINGDGYSDVEMSNDKCSTFYFKGSSTGLQDSICSVGAGCNGPSLGPGGSDLNGDGFADVGIGVGIFGFGVYVTFGGATGSTATSVNFPITATSPSGGALTTPFPATNLGDVNGDAIGDFALPYWGAPTNTPVGLEIFLGSASLPGGPAPKPAKTFPFVARAF